MGTKSLLGLVRSRMISATLVPRYRIDVVFSLGQNFMERSTEVSVAMANPIRRIFCCLLSCFEDASAHLRHNRQSTLIMPRSSACFRPLRNKPKLLMNNYNSEPLNAAMVLAFLLR